MSEPIKYEHLLNELEELEEKRKEKQYAHSGKEAIDYVQKNRVDAKDISKNLESRINQQKMMNEGLYMTAKEKRKAIEEEKEKQHILKLNKWDLVRHKRE